MIGRTYENIDCDFSSCPLVEILGNSVSSGDHLHLYT